MRDTIRDDYSRQTGEYNYSLKSRLKPRCGPCIHISKTMASGPLISGGIENCQSHKIRDLIHEDNLFVNRKKAFLIFVALVTFCIDAKLEAVPVFESEIEFEWPGTDILEPGRNSFMNDFIPFPCSWLINSGLSDTIYSEWIAFQDLRYKFLEKRYNIVGGSYEPGSIGCHYKQKLTLYVIVQDEDNKEDEGIDIQGQISKKIVSDDVIFRSFFPMDTLQDASIETIHNYNTVIDINTVPEPSAIVLFAFTAFGFLHTKKR